MKIAQVAPLYESVPPSGYGGTERIVSFLTEELVRQGHDVTLFASGDSKTAAALVPCSERSLRRHPEGDPIIKHFIQTEEVFRKEFDIIHFHTDFLHFPASSRSPRPHLTTLHGRLDLPSLPPLYQHFPETPLVSISNSQRRPLPDVNWLTTIYHGLPDELFHLDETPEDYLIFLGRICADKGIKDAIEIAIRSNTRLIIAAKVDPVDRKYHKTEIEPLLNHPLIEFIGEVDDRQKQRLVGGARALLFPIQWPEPFGLVMIEAMACGTPVVAYPQGSVPEILEHGRTGFLVSHIDEAVAAVKQVSQIDRRVCRETFERRFSIKRAAADYVRQYEIVAQSAAESMGVI